MRTMLVGQFGAQGVGSGNWLSVEFACPCSEERSFAARTTKP